MAAVASTDRSCVFETSPRDLKAPTPHSCVHVHYITQQEGSSLPFPTFYLPAILFLTPYSIIIVIIFIITHQQEVTEFEKWICNFFFSCPQYEGSVNEVLFFVTNVKTQTFYRIVQVFFLLFGKEGGSHLSTCVVFRIVPAYVVVLLSFQMKIYMNIYEDNTSLKLQVWLRYLSSTYYNFFKMQIRMPSQRVLFPRISASFYRFSSFTSITSGSQCPVEALSCF